MEKCTDGRICLICRRVTLESSSINSEKLISNASLLQDFLNCFHVNVLDRKVNDLSKSCQFCPTCEQFVAEWSSIQIQMTQLSRRAAQLEATLSALLLCAPQIQETNHDSDVNEVINSRIQKSEEVELPLLLQQTVDDIRNDLRKEYSVSVMLEKIPFPSVQKLEPLPIDYESNDEAWDHWECLPNIQLPVPKSEPLLSCHDNDSSIWKVDSEVADNVVPLPVSDTPSVNDLTSIQGEFQSIPFTFNPAQVLTLIPLSLTCPENVATSSRNAVRRGPSSRLDRSRNVRVCMLCPQQAAFEHKNPRKVREHVAKVHNAGKIYQCPHCGLILSRAEGLKRHVRKFHGS